MNSTNRIEELQAELIRNHARIKQCLRDLHSKVDHLIELHAELRKLGLCSNEYHADHGGAEE